jgi:hypothetical protein
LGFDGENHPIDDRKVCVIERTDEGLRVGFDPWGVSEQLKKEIFDFIGWIVVAKAHVDDFGTLRGGA